MPITYDGKDVTDMVCEICLEPVAKQVGNATIMENYTYFNGSMRHSSCKPVDSEKFKFFRDIFKK